jgi:hypothetical protein
MEQTWGWDLELMIMGLLSCVKGVLQLKKVLDFPG